MMINPTCIPFSIRVWIRYTDTCTPSVSPFCNNVYLLTCVPCAFVAILKYPAHAPTLSITWLDTCYLCAPVTCLRTALKTWLILLYLPVTLIYLTCTLYILCIDIEYSANLYLVYASVTATDFIFEEMVAVGFAVNTTQTRYKDICKRAMHNILCCCMMIRILCDR